VQEKEGSVFLKYIADHPTGELLACVNLQKQGERVYVGMFAVQPNHQGGGLGKALLRAADEWAAQAQCTSLYMHVISVRAELIQWYQRHGYVDTLARIPFEEDGESGAHLQKLEFMLLEKQLSPAQS
jgi:GNAT superfamily N-acetyltransferase